ncbi:MAG: hypothetical protein WAQ27_04015 [Candidatus Microsaccharimonas sp.]
MDTFGNSPETSHATPENEQPEITPELIVLKLEGILDDDDLEFLKEQLDEGLDTEDLLGQVYGMLLNVGQDPDEVLAVLGITEA